MPKYVFMCGLVNSGAGKGLAISSIAKLMQMRSQNVNIMKLEPYINAENAASTIRPSDHGEPFQTDTITADLDLGTYERFLNIKMRRDNLWTTGMLYKELIERQEKGEWLGDTIQMVPHLVNLIKEKVEGLDKNSDVIFVEVGGTVGDFESSHYFEFLRRFKNKHRNDVAVVVLAPIIRTSTDGEPKTKPLQNGIKQLNSYGLHADILICRVDNKPIPNQIFDKVADMTGIPREAIFIAPDVDTVYKIPLVFHKQNIDDYLSDLLHLPRKPCKIYKYRELVNKFDEELQKVKIGVVGKYVNHGDAYLSIKEALCHAGLDNDTKVEIDFISAEEVEKNSKMLQGLHGCIVPGGFSERGFLGKIEAIKFCRENGVPNLNICLGLQAMVIEYNRNVMKIKEAYSQEFDINTKHPVVHYIEGQKDNKSGSHMRLGLYDCEIDKDSMMYDLFKKKIQSFRHRHKLEINSKYITPDMDLKVTGINPQTGLIEVVENKNHPFMIGVQFHPEFTSSLVEPSPLFIGFIKAALDYKSKTQSN